jgi:hypothetical protein
MKDMAQIYYKTFGTNIQYPFDVLAAGVEHLFEGFKIHFGHIEHVGASGILVDVLLFDLDGLIEHAIDFCPDR